METFDGLPIRIFQNLKTALLKHFKSMFNPEKIGLVKTNKQVLTTASVQ